MALGDSLIDVDIRKQRSRPFVAPAHRSASRLDLANQESHPHTRWLGVFQQPVRGDTADAFRDGWFYPGDLAAINDEGFVFLKGRAKDMIIRGGVNIYPADVERALMEISGVVEAAVIPRPSAEMGEEMAAYVVASQPMTAEAVQAECRARLAPYKVPRYVRFVESLPKNAFGKILKSELAARDGQ